MTRGLVALEGVGYHYHGTDRPAVECLSLQLTRGETVGIRGASACGKSTALGVISGELPLLWGGRLEGEACWAADLSASDETSGTPDITRIGALLGSPQESFAGFLDSVREELAFDLEARAWDVATSHRRVTAVSEAFGIAHLLDREPFALSGGERQRVALALSAVGDPLLVVLDDPEAHLDTYSRQSWLPALREVLRGDATIAFEGRGRISAVGSGVRTVNLKSTHNGMPGSQRDRIELPPLSTSVSRLRLNCRAAGYSGTQAPVVRDLKIALQAGQCLGLIGPNGAGKSTLLKALGGTLPVFDGELDIDGQGFASTPAHKRCRTIALSLQDPRDQLFAPTVREEIAFAGRVARNLNSEELAVAVELYAAVLGVGHLLNRHPRELSRSETRRVGIASVLVLDAPVLLLDEPTVGMDSDGMELLSRLITEHKARGGCLIVASHEREWLSAVADSLVTLDPRPPVM